MPADAKTIQAGVDRARPGDLVLVSPGVYREEVTSRPTASCCAASTATRTILDGDFKRENGVKVLGADGVAIENLTTRNYTENGFFWNGVLGYRGSYLTAYRNGDYGIFAFDSQWGSSTTRTRRAAPTRASTSASAIRATRSSPTWSSEYNQLGYSGTNAAATCSS